MFGSDDETINYMRANEAYMAQVEIAKLRHEIASLKSEIARLREALSRHGEHRQECAIRMTDTNATRMLCNCGLDAALSEIGGEGG